MHITVWHSHYFGKEPAPSGTKVTEADIAAGKATLAADDRVLLRVHKPAPDGETHTSRAQGELPLCDFILFAKLYPEGRWSDEWDSIMGKQEVTRYSAATFYTMKQMREHARPKHFTRIHVYDEDGPQPAVFRMAAQRFLRGGAAYNQARQDGVAQAALDDRFRLTPENLDKWLAEYAADKTHPADHMTDHFETERHLEPHEKGAGK